LVVAVPVMPVLRVVVSGIVGAGAGKERASEKKEEGFRDSFWFHRVHASSAIETAGHRE